jgi:hypothetical protein
MAGLSPMMNDPVKITVGGKASGKLVSASTSPTIGRDRYIRCPRSLEPTFLDALRCDSNRERLYVRRSDAPRTEWERLAYKVLTNAVW